MKAQLEKLIAEAISVEFGSDITEGVVFSVSSPPKPEMGDYATNVAMILAKKVGQSPKEVAEKLANRISNDVQKYENPLEKVEVLGGFINFTIKPEYWFKEVVEEIKNQKSEYGMARVTIPEKIMVEYLSPNTNKPIHLGHLRNGVTGVATINVLKAQGHTVTAVGIINDRGVHICKAMLAYQRWGEDQTPGSTGKKPDHFVGDWYVRFAQEAALNPKLEIEAQEMLQQWEAGDSEIRELWQRMRQWVLDGWKETESTLGFVYDRPYYESEVYELGKDIVEQGLQKGVFRKNDKGNTVFDLSEEEFGTDEEGNARVVTVLRPDGTSLYTTQDLGLAVKRSEEYHLDRLVYVVGSEQRAHFQALFAMLRALGYDWAKKLYHLWYAMVYLPDGKMKSREGTVVDADDLIEQMVGFAKAEIDVRSNRTDGTNKSGGITQEEKDSRAKTIALGAIKFYLLKQKPTIDIHFNPKESISFEGHTGPYCQYAYARARSIVRAVMEKTGDTSRQIEYGLLGDNEERKLLQKLEEFPEAVRRAADDYNVALIATHIFETSQAFNSFYTSHSVLKAESPQIMAARLALVEAAAQVIKNGLRILGIETLEEM